MHATNLTLSENSSAISSSRTKYSSKEVITIPNTSSGGSNIFTPMQTSMLNMKFLMKTANDELFDFTAEISFENQSKTESNETWNLKRKLNTTREAHTFTKEIGNEKRAKTKKESCKN